MISNEQGMNPLMFAAANDPDAVNPLLNAMHKLSLDDQEKILMQSDENYMNALMYAVSSQPVDGGRCFKNIMKSIEKLPPERMGNIFTQTDSLGRNALMLAVINENPESVALLCGAIEKLPPKEQKAIFKSLGGVLMYAVQKAPDLVAPLCQTIAKLPLAERRDILTAKDENGWNVLMHANAKQPKVVDAIKSAAAGFFTQMEYPMLVRSILEEVPEDMAAWKMYKLFEKWNKYLQDGLFDDESMQATLKEERQLLQGTSNPNGLYLLGLMHKHGVGGKVNTEEATKYFQQAMKLDNPGPREELEGLAQHGETEKSAALYDVIKDERLHAETFASNEDYASAIVHYDRAVGLGDPLAMFSRASMHLHGEGGPVDYTAARHLYEKIIASESPLVTQDNLSALNYLANMKFDSHLNVIRAKTNEMAAKAETTDRYQEAQDKGAALFSSLVQAGQRFVSTNNPSNDGHTKEEFKEDCREAIKEAKPTLEKHRGWGRVLELIVNCINKITPFNFKSFKTDFSKKVDTLKQAVDPESTQDSEKKPGPR